MDGIAALNGQQPPPRAVCSSVNNKPYSKRALHEQPAQPGRWRGGAGLCGISRHATARLACPLTARQQRPQQSDGVGDLDSQPQPASHGHRGRPGLAPRPVGHWCALDAEADGLGAELRLAGPVWPDQPALHRHQRRLRPAGACGTRLAAAPCQYPPSRQHGASQGRGRRRWRVAGIGRHGYRGHDSRPASAPAWPGARSPAEQHPAGRAPSRRQCRRHGQQHQPCRRRPGLCIGAAIVGQQPQPCKLCWSPLAAGPPSVGLSQGQHHRFTKPRGTAICWSRPRSLGPSALFLLPGSLANIDHPAPPADVVHKPVQWTQLHHPQGCSAPGKQPISSPPSPVQPQPAILISRIIVHSPTRLPLTPLKRDTRIPAFQCKEEGSGARAAAAGAGRG